MKSQNCKSSIHQIDRANGAIEAHKKQLVNDADCEAKVDIGS